MEPVLETESGPVRGAREGPLCVFRGVPYAAPPTGALRFAPPRPPPRWDGVRDASRFGTAPPQRLREVPVERLLAAQSECLAEGPFATGMLFAPIVDGALLPELPADAVRRGAASDVDLVIGTTADEMMLYGAEEPAGVPDAARVALLAAQLGGPRTRREERARRLLDAYRDARAARRTFSYLFVWRSPLRGGAYGSCHALDLPFTFGNLDVPGIAEFAGEGPAALRLAGEIMDAWLAFAASGDPAHPGIGPWPLYTEERRGTMLFGERSGAVDAPFEAERAAWEPAGA